MYASLRAVSVAGLLLWAGGTATLGAQEGPPKELLFGHTVRLRLRGGVSARGELLGISDDSMSVLGENHVVRNLGLGEVISVDVARHSFGWGKVISWTAVGALVTGGGLMAACNSVEDTDNDCGGVFVAAAASWALFGGIFGVALNAQRWQSVSPSPPALRRFARYPQGIPQEAADSRRVPSGDSASAASGGRSASGRALSVRRR